MKELRWVCGLTTVPARRDLLLPATLASLHAAGFPTPRLFVDGVSGRPDWVTELVGEKATTRWPKVRAYANWLLGLVELYLREPAVDRYLIVQDDVLLVQNLRTYLDRCAYPRDGYWNCYSFPENEELAPRGPDGKPKSGWYRSNQKGKGALALVFDNAAVQLMLTHQAGGGGTPVQYLVNHPQNVGKGWRGIDGAVVTALNRGGRKELVHWPSLAQHQGQAHSEVSGRPRPEQWQSHSFPGAGFDAMTLLQPRDETVATATTTATDERVARRVAISPDPEAEIAGILRAIAADEERLRRATTLVERQRLARWRRHYEERLKALGHRR